MNALEELDKIIQTLGADKILTLSRDGFQPPEGVINNVIENAATLSQLPRYRLACVYNFPENLSSTEGMQIIAALRDLKAEIVYLLLDDEDSRWNDHDLRALGFRHIKNYPEDTPTKTLYYFDIYDYKLTPDWLNPRFWANPERWDIFDG